MPETIYHEVSFRVTVELEREGAEPTYREQKELDDTVKNMLESVTGFEVEGWEADWKVESA